MSHFTVLVIGHDVDAAMAPYQENNFGTTEDKYLEYEDIDLADHGYKTHQEAIDDGYHDKDGKATSVCNPNSFFDYYSEGGRWKGMLTTREGVAVDSAYKKDIDFDGMYKDAIDKATARYERSLAIFGELPVHKSIRELSAEITGEETIYYDRDVTKQAKVKWLLQPRVVAFKMAEETDPEFRLFADDYLVTKEHYINHAKMSRIACYGILISGEEYQSKDFHGEDEFLNLFAKTIDNADDDDLITILDCHV